MKMKNKNEISKKNYSRHFFVNNEKKKIKNEKRLLVRKMRRVIRRDSGTAEKRTESLASYLRCININFKVFAREKPRRENEDDEASGPSSHGSSGTVWARVEYTKKILRVV